MSIRLHSDETSTIQNVIEYNRKSSKVCIFSHFDDNDTIAPYVLFYLRALNKMGFLIVFVTTSKIKPHQLAGISKYLKCFIQRKNAGYDFVSYKIGLSMLRDYRDYKTILFANDSIFFPLYHPRTMFTTMRQKNLDFWGITASYEIQYHVQSFFWVFGSKALHSKAFYEFWNRVQIIKQKSDIILTYEVPMAENLRHHGLRVGAWVDTSAILKNLSSDTSSHLLQMNPFYYFWNILIESFKAPFVKKNILLQHSEQFNISTIAYTSTLEKTHYDSRLIAQYLKRSNAVSTTLEQELLDCYNKAHPFFESTCQLLAHKRVILYGANDIGMALQSLAETEKTVVVDRNHMLLAEHFGLPILAPEAIATLNYDMILVTALAHTDSIRNHLSSMYIKMDNVHFLSEMDAQHAIEGVQKIFKFINVIYLSHLSGQNIPLKIKSTRLISIINNYMLLYHRQNNFFTFHHST